MKVKENIYDAINKMNVNELSLLYEQIKLLEKVKSISVKKKQHFSIEQIHEMTSLSKSCWSDAVIEERVERI